MHLTALRPVFVKVSSVKIKPTTFFEKVQVCRKFMVGAKLDEKKKKYNKSNLPYKICVVCNKPMNWRKKWEKVWDEVKYCSERCRRSSKSGTSSQPADEPA